MKYDVVTIGTATKDVFLSSREIKILHDPEHLKKIGFATGEATCFALGAKIEIEAPFVSGGGGAANSAVTFAKQGLKTAAVVRIGRDSAGKEILDNFKENKISGVAAYDKKMHTAYSTLLLTPGGERTILVHRGAAEGWNIKDIPFSKINTKWVYLSPGNMPAEMIKKMVSRFVAKGVRIAINPSRGFIEHMSSLAGILKKADLIIVNREEASYLTGVAFDDAGGIFKKLDDMVGGVAVMTDGAKGAFVSDGNRIYSCGVFEGKCIDRTGAGDAFGSGFAAGLMRGKAKNAKWTEENIKYAIRLATANATSVVENLGAQAGILTRFQYEKERRWQKLDIAVH